MAVDQAQAGVAQPAQRQPVGLEQALEAFHRRHHAQVVRHPPPLEATQHAFVGKPFAALQGVQQDLGQHRRIEEAQVHALSGQRVDGVRSIADQRQARLDVTLGVPLAQRDAQAPVGMQDGAQALFEGFAEGGAEAILVQRHQAFCLFRGGRPDDRAPVLVAAVRQGQEGQRTVVGEALPGGCAVRVLAAHAGDDGVVQVIPFAGGAAGQAAYRRVGAVGGDHQRRTQLATVGQDQQPVVAGVAHLFQARIGQQAGGGIVQAFQQGVLHHPVLDDMAEYLGVHAGGAEADPPGAGAIPHLHLAIGLGAARDDAVPGMQALENPPAGFGQRADPRLVGRLRLERRHVERAAVHQQHLQAAALQGQGQGATDHAGADDDQIRVHILVLHSWALFRPRSAGAA